MQPLRYPCISQLCPLKHINHDLHSINIETLARLQHKLDLLLTEFQTEYPLSYNQPGTFLEWLAHIFRFEMASAGRPRLALGVQSLPGISESEASATSSPARGKEMKQTLLGKLRPPAFVHSWEFSHDRQDRGKRTDSPPQTDAEKKDEADSYAERLVILQEISDVRDFWSVFNNFNLDHLPQKDSVHLFKKGVKPVWEDPRNVRGGAWYFRVPKEKAGEVWKSIAMSAVGEELQQCVETQRINFNDDLCGISYSVRFGACIITIWNRDANHDAGKEKLKNLVLEKVDQIWTPLASQVYYKKHSEHAGFVASKAASPLGR